MSTQPTVSSLKTLREAKTDSFIFEQSDALDSQLCDDIIERFEAANNEHQQGRVGAGVAINLELKRSTDLYISNKPQWQDIDQALYQSAAKALAELAGPVPYFRKNFKDSGYAVQRTATDEFYQWHTDADNPQLSGRQLVLIWYLNDVAGPGGETEFFFQGVSIKPERGKLLLFPPFWTHQHRGAVLRAQDTNKYIATTWLTFSE